MNPVDEDAPDVYIPQQTLEKAVLCKQKGILVSFVGAMLTIFPFLNNWVP